MGKKALVTGASSGIGLAYAKILGKEGWDLVITGRREDLLRKNKESLQEEFSVVVDYYVVDFSDKESFSLFIESVLKVLKFEFVVNNVGFSNHTDFFNTPFLLNKKMIDVHINSMAEIIHLVVPYMKSIKRGSIINVSSLASFLPSLSDPFYSGTKAFINTYSESIYLILKPYGIKVQSLCPGFTVTDFHRGRNINRSKLWMNPYDVALYSFKKISSNRVICIPGFFYKLIFFVVKFIPKILYYKLAGRDRVLDEK